MNKINPFNKQQRQLSVDEMNKILIENVPFKERMDAVYIPIVAQDCACYLCEDVISILRELRVSDTKKSCRELKTYIKEYRDGNRRAMTFELFEDLQKKSKGVYNWIATDMFIYILQYTQGLYNEGFKNFNQQQLKVISEAYVVRQILRYVIQLDRDFSKKISSLLPIEVHYHTDDNEYAVKMIKSLNGIFKVFKVPDELDSVNIQLSYKVFQNRMHQFHIGYEEHTLEGKEKEMYEKGYCRCEDCEWSSLIKNGECKKGQRTIDTTAKRKCWRKCNLFKK